MIRRHALLAPLALAACGGGEVQSRLRILSPGDSLASGQIGTPAGAPLEYLPHRPAERLQEALGLGVEVVDAAQAGQRAVDGRRALPDLLAGQGFRVVLLRWGGADAVSPDPTPLDVFENALFEMVCMCTQAGAQPVLVGMPHFVDFENRLHATDIVIRRLALATRTPRADCWAVPPGRIVAGHPDQAYADALMVPIAQTVREVLS